MVYENLMPYVKEQMKLRGIKKEEMACALRISVTGLYQKIKQPHRISLKEAEIIAGKFGVTVDELLKNVSEGRSYGK